MIATVAVSFSAILIRYAGDDAATIVWLRMGIAAVVLLPWVARDVRRRVTEAHTYLRIDEARERIEDHPESAGRFLPQPWVTDRKDEYLRCTELDRCGDRGVIRDGPVHEIAPADGHRRKHSGDGGAGEQRRDRGPDEIVTARPVLRSVVMMWTGTAASSSNS